MDMKFYIDKESYDRERKDSFIEGIGFGIAGTIIIFALLLAIAKYCV